MDNPQPIRQPTPIQDSLETQRKNFNLGYGQRVSPSLSAKQAMQQLYKNQLDSLVLEKQKQKEVERQRAVSQKREFNERAQQGKEAERMKEISYKNYYNMLLSNQNHNIETYVSPFSKRDAMKDTLIAQNMEDERKKYQQFDVEARKRQQERKNIYRNQLLDQIEERKRKEYLARHNMQKQKEEFQLNAKAPEEIRRYEKERKKEEVEKYREDLDRMREGRQQRSQSQSQTGLARGSVEFHNILTNPLPYNIQNPYILKEMGVPKNQSYLAMKGSQNLKLT